MEAGGTPTQKCWCFGGCDDDTTHWPRACRNLVTDTVRLSRETAGQLLSKGPERAGKEAAWGFIVDGGGQARDPLREGPRMVGVFH